MSSIMPQRPLFPDDSLGLLLSRCGELLAATAGQHFAPERQPDLARALAQELGGGSNLRNALEDVLSTPFDSPRLEALASLLINGETYFFRDPGIFAALRQVILPGLIRERAAAGAKRLRIWSAGCSTGEEAYSIAVALAQVLPGLEHWDARILATDINRRALAQAAQGIYGERAFRGALPDPSGNHFVRDKGGRYHVAPRIKALVSFAPLNLATRSYPASNPDTQAMDVIFCRNVLMYFQPEQARAVAERLVLCLADGGWLVVSPVEAPLVAAPGLVSEFLCGSLVFRRRAAARPVPRPPVPSLVPPRARVSAKPPREIARQIARGLADRGRLREALARCDKEIAANPLDPAWTYLQASILLEMGKASEAGGALRRTLYLDPERPMAEFALGNLLARQGSSEAERHYRNALASLERWPADKAMPDLEGLTSGRMRAILQQILKAAP